jgi:glycosyltransferase involved in cell wall biosynthesis
MIVAPDETHQATAVTAPTEVRATVIMPTTGDRGPALEIAISSVLRQTLNDIEVFIVGDGVDDVTRRVARALSDRDERVRFFDHPKHPRRGEPYRHDLLTNHARGRIVAYLCDRDLWFSDHLAELDRMLVDRDLATTLEFDPNDERPHTIRYRQSLAGLATLPADQRIKATPSRLSAAGHTLDAYRRLPHGWRETPPDRFTDRYMWEQFLDQPWIQVTSSSLPTLLYLKRGDHPGLPTDQRRQLLEHWNARLLGPYGECDLRAEVLNDLWEHWRRLEAQRPSRIVKRNVRALGRHVGLRL